MAHWKHGWIPLTPTAIRQKNHGFKPGPKSKLGRMKHGSHTNVHKVTDSKGNQHHISGPSSGKLAAHLTANGWTADKNVSSHEGVLAGAPKELRDLWHAAHQNGWNAQLQTGRNAKGERTHKINLSKPGQQGTDTLAWEGGKFVPGKHGSGAFAATPKSQLGRIDPKTGKRQRTDELSALNRKFAANRAEKARKAAEDKKRQRAADEKAANQKLKETRRAVLGAEHAHAARNKLNYDGLVAAYRKHYGKEPDASLLRRWAYHGASAEETKSGWYTAAAAAKQRANATGAHKKSALAKPARPVRKPTRP